MGRRLRFLMFVVIVLAIWALMHVYVGWRLGSLPLFAEQRRWLVLGLTVLALAYPVGRILFHHGAPGLGTVIEWIGAAWMGTLILLVSAFLLVDVVTLFGLILKPHLAALRGAAAGLAGLLTIVALVGGHLRPRVVELELELPGLPAAADGLVIVQLSDLHLGSLIGPRALRATIARVESLRPDLVAITGDLVDAEAGMVERMLPELSTLTAPRGVYAVLGNHEYYAGEQRSRGLLKAAGFTVLDNAAAEAAPGLWLAGVADTTGGRQTGGLEGDLGAALAQVPDGAATVLLQHTPAGEHEAAAGGVNLMLNGHTHGAQIWPAHYLVRLQFPFLAGVRTVDGMTQVVCRGAGRWGPPMRLFAPSEIYRITVRAAD
jgi:predicted MPP superfamily phosphohydrolase